MSKAITPYAVLRLGCLSFGPTWDVQRELARLRLHDRIPDVLILVEHPPVITVGRSGHRGNILVSESILRREGIELVHVDRGGDVTYHGPGQLVGYPILNLRNHGQDLHLYVRQLEATLVGALAEFGLEASRRPGLVGVWAGDRKVASIGVNVRKWISTHGFALNVKTDLQPFQFIHACGLRDRPMISMAELLGRCVGLEEVAEKVVSHFERVFGTRCEAYFADPETLKSFFRVASFSEDPALGAKVGSFPEEPVSNGMRGG